jgi:branched-chain amino acid transport system permease protein
VKLNLLIQLMANGLVQGAIYSLLAVGFGILYRSLRFFDISYGALYTVSGYFMFVLIKLLHFDIFSSFLLSIILTMLLATGFEKGIYFHFYKRSASPIVMLVASLGIYIFMVNLIALLFGNDIKVLSAGIEPSFRLGEIILIRIQVIQLAAGVIFTFALFFLLSKSKYIKALWALGDEPELVEVLNLPLKLLRVLAFILAGFFVGTASILTALDVGMDPHGGLNALLSAAVAVIIGGIDSIAGWIVGAYMLALIQSLVIFQFSSRWTPLVTFGLLIIILLTKPQGILGLKKRLEE